MFNKDRFYFLVIVCLVILTGCVSGQQGPQNPAQASPDVVSMEQEPAVSPSQTQVPSTPTDTPTQADSPTPMPSSTHTPSSTPEPSNTPTVTPTSTPAGLQPGIYGVGGCAEIKLSGNWSVDWCVVNVIVNRDQTMTFNVSWLGHLPGGYTKLTKRSDENNPKMYVTDNLGNHYDFVSLGGYAAKAVVMVSETSYPGSFVFPPAQPGALTFTFHDSNNGVKIENLRLDKPTIPIYELAFQNGLALEYRDDLWELQQDENGKAFLNYKPQENCRLQEAETSEPTGKLKNTVEIGQMTFEIYGKLEEKWGTREYLIVKSPEELALQTKPMFLVRLPLENSLQCLNDVSTLLFSLR